MGRVFSDASEPDTLMFSRVYQWRTPGVVMWRNINMMPAWDTDGS
jgi:hypothetical protein